MMISMLQILKVALKFNASDVHIVAGAPPVVRTFGDAIPLKTKPLSSEDTRQIIYSILTDRQKSILEEKKDFDFSFEIKELCRCRGNAFFQKGVLSGVFRIVPSKIPELHTLGLPPTVLNLSEYKSGLVLVTGTTGSGKTTTIASLLNALGKESRKHIVTLEDPIEYNFQHTKSIFNQREVGLDTYSLENGMKSLLRQDVDICFIGELRTYESIEIALCLAESGQLVFSTLHTNTAVGTLQRILGQFPPEEQARVQGQLSMCLRAVYAQQLIKNIHGKMVLAVEIFKIAPNVQNLIREGKFHQIYGLMQTGQGSTGMITMNQALLSLIERNLITVDTAFRSSPAPDELAQKLKSTRFKKNIA